MWGRQSFRQAFVQLCSKILRVFRRQGSGKTGKKIRYRGGGLRTGSAVMGGKGGKIRSYASSRCLGHTRIWICREPKTAPDTGGGHIPRSAGFVLAALPADTRKDARRCSLGFAYAVGRIILTCLGILYVCSVLGTTAGIKQERAGKSTENMALHDAHISGGTGRGKFPESGAEQGAVSELTPAKLCRSSVPVRFMPVGCRFRAQPFLHLWELYFCIFQIIN